jgi:glucose-1-phosphate adenylyltransferase
MMQNIQENTVTFVLAGGRGERLDPLTRGRAKPAVPFGDGRIIDFTLSNCLRSTLPLPYILTQYQADSLQQHVGRWWRLHAAEAAGVAVPVCVSASNGASYRGTGDALRQNIDRFTHADYVAVLSADHVYEMDYRELIRFHVANGAAATIGSIVYPKSFASQFGVMEVDSRWRIRSFHEKPRNPVTLPDRPDKILASMGIYVFDAAVLAEVLKPGGFSKAGDSCDIGRDVLPRLAADYPVYAFNFADNKTGHPLYWRDVGTLDSYYSTAMELFGTSGSVISRDAHVHETAEVVDSIILPGVRVGRGARVRGAILDENVCVPAGIDVGYGRHDASLFTVTPKGIVVVPANTSLPRVRTFRTDFQQTVEA